MNLLVYLAFAWSRAMRSPQKSLSITTFTFVDCTEAIKAQAKNDNNVMNSFFIYWFYVVLNRLLLYFWNISG